VAYHSVFRTNSCIIPNSAIELITGSSLLIFSFLNYVIILIFELTTPLVSFLPTCYESITDIST
jgi:hypothetical protein